MHYGLVYFPKLEKDSINKIRQKYDPTYKIIAPHLTILFPVPSSIGKIRIIKHINNVLKKQHPIKVHFSSYKKSWDHWLLLTMGEGETEIIGLSMSIYSGILSKYRRKDIEFIPHIGLGLFAKDYKKYDFENPKRLALDKEKYQEALREAESTIRNFKCKVDNLDLVEADNDFTSIKTIKKFKLQ